MSNIIRLNETAPNDEWITMSNQGTDCFLDLLITASDNFEKTEQQKELISFLKDQKDINAVAPGTAGFDLNEIAWQQSTLKEDAEFLIRVAEEAKREKTFRKLPYDVNTGIVLPWLERFALLLDQMTEDNLCVKPRFVEGTTMFYDVSDLKTDDIFLKLNKTCNAEPEKQWVPAYYFDICLLDGTKIGYCDLRIGHNAKTYIGGNIGYGIDEPYRGHHYAAKACALLFRQAKKHHMDYLTISCQPSNKASARTCELAGGTYIETADIPEDNEMYIEGKRQVMIFRFDL